MLDRPAEAVDELRSPEVARLHAMQAALWEQAIAGDTKAAHAILRIVDTLIMLLGLAARRDLVRRNLGGVSDCGRHPLPPPDGWTEGFVHAT